jgi:plasmid maintenance system antidote protein VapI
MANRQNFWDIMAAKTQQEIAEHLAIKQSNVSRIKSAERGFSPEIARKIAAKTGEPAPLVYLRSQLESMEHRAVTKSMSETGFLGSAEHVMRNITGKFYDHEMRAARKDPEFVTAANRLRELLLKALDLVGPDDQGPTVTGDSTQVAAKSSDAVERDAQGVRVKKGEPVLRDAYGRVLKD